MNQKQISKAKLKKRAERLVELVSSSSHSSLIAQEILLIVKAGMGYCPKALNHTMETENDESADGTENDGTENEECVCWVEGDRCENSF